MHRAVLDKMGAISGIARWLIGVFNGFLGVVTVGMIAGGIVIKFASSILKDFGNTQLEEIQKSVEALFPGQSWSTDSWDLNDILGNVAIFLIVAGAVFLIICIIGCSASCLKVKTLLLVYTVVVAVLFLTQIIMLIVVYASPYAVKDPVKSSLTESLKNFQGLNGTNTNSVTWNFMMRYYACCGVSNYQDFKNYSTWWGITEHVTPYACCTELPTTSTEADTCAGISSNLPPTFIKDHSNYNYGCVDAAGDFFFVKNKTYVLAAVVSVFVAQALLIACSIVLIKEKDGKVQPLLHDEYSRSRPPKLPDRPLRSMSNMYTDVPDMNYRTKF